MSDRILAATRKGVFTLDRNTAASCWRVTNVAFLGENATMVMADPRHGNTYAALNLGHFGTKLHRSNDGGETWTECSVPAYPEWTEEDEAKHAAAGEIGARRDFSSLKEIWSMETGGPDQPDLVWAGTIPGGLFRSTDHGESWEMVRSLWDRDERWQWFGGGKDHPGIHSICVDSRESARVHVGVSCGGVWMTADGGETWECRAHGMRAEYMPPEQQFDPNLQDPHCVVQCRDNPDVLWAQHHNGIFRTADGGKSWAELQDVAPSAFGFPVAVHPADADTAWFVPGVKDECRVPVDGKLVVTRTRDGGQSFESLTSGLPQQHCYDLVYRHALIVDDVGERLAMGSTSGALWVTDDGGESWECVTPHLPPVHCLRFV